MSLSLQYKRAFSVHTDGKRAVVDADSECERAFTTLLIHQVASPATRMY